jgi:hypothetical protein
MVREVREAEWMMRRHGQGEWGCDGDETKQQQQQNREKMTAGDASE